MKEIIKDIRKKQDEMILMVNSTFDAIVEEVKKINNISNFDVNDYELEYPLTNTSGFKGKKVIAVVINKNRYIAPTWKSVVKIILKDAIKNPKYRKNLHNLSNKILGRTRVRLSSSDDNMRSPVEIEKDLYVETHYDTESLMNLLLQVLNEISYDYSNVKIIIKN